MKKKAEEQIYAFAFAFTYKEAGILMGKISETTVRKLVTDGELEAVTIGKGRKVIPRESIDKYFSEKKYKNRMVPDYEKREEP